MLVLLFGGGCSGPSNLPEARNELDHFLSEDFAPGQPFADFHSRWKDHATLDELQAELISRKVRVGTPAEEARVILTDALANSKRKNLDWARASFAELRDHPGFGQMLTEVINQGKSTFVADLVEEVSAVYTKPKPDNGRSLEDPFSYGGDGYKLLSAIADVPAAMWPLWLALKDQSRIDEDMGDGFLRRMTARSLLRDPERFLSFLEQTPLLKPVANLDAVEMAGQSQPTLLEALGQGFQSSSLNDDILDRIFVLIDKTAADSLGRQILAAHRLENQDIPEAVAVAFVDRLDELRKLPADRQRDLAGLASRLTIGRGRVRPEISGKDAAPFLAWLAGFGEVPLGGIAGPWLAAARWEDLPLNDSTYSVGSRLREMLHPLRASDPAQAGALLIHVTKLDRERTPAAEYANRYSTIAEDVLRQLLFEDKTPLGQAFCMDTFVDGKDELGTSFFSKYSEWLNYNVYDAAENAGKTKEERLPAVLNWLKLFGREMKSPDKRIMLGLAVDLAKKFPFSGLKFEDFLVAIETELDRPELTDSAEREVLTVFADGARLLKRKTTGAPLDAVTVERRYLEAIRDTTRPWTWRFALASSTLLALDSEMSQDFIGESFDLLLQGYQDQRRMTKDQLSAVVRAIDNDTDTGRRAGRVSRHLPAWKKRHLKDHPADHLNNTLARIMMMAWERGDDATPDQVLATFDDELPKHPASFFAAVAGGRPSLAFDRQRTWMQGFHYHPRNIDWKPLFAERTAAYLDFLKGQTGTGDDDPAALALHARAMFCSIDRVAKDDQWKAECVSIAEGIAAAYRASDAPPLAVNRALYLMAGLNPSPRELAAPLRVWAKNYDLLAFFTEGTRTDDIDIRPIQLNAKYTLEDRDMDGIRRLTDTFTAVSRLKSLGVSPTYRDPFFESTRNAASKGFDDTLKESASPPETLGTWMALFRSFAGLPRLTWNQNNRGREIERFYVAAILSGDEREIEAWWKPLAPNQREFVEYLCSDSRNLFSDSAAVAMRAKWVRDSPEVRKKVALGLLSAPGVRHSVEFAPQWQKTRLASAADLVAWGAELIAAAPRGGYTAYAVARAARETGQLDTALAHIDAALSAASADTKGAASAFQWERARILAEMGRFKEAVTLLKTVAPSLTGTLKAEADALLPKWQATPPTAK